MVDFRKRAEKAAGPLLHAGEQVLAGVNVFPSPFRVAGGMTGGLIAGGAVGAAVGAAWDARNEKREDTEASVRPVPAVASRPEVDPGVPSNGGLLAVTTDRILLWSISGMGKGKDLLQQASIHDVDQAAWQRVEAGWIRGKPASLLMWIGLGDRVLTAAAVDMAASGKHARALVEVLTERRPGRVVEFTP